MTIEELSIEATDMENFSHDGNVVVERKSGDRLEVKDVHYDTVSKELVIEVE